MNDSQVRGIDKGRVKQESSITHGAPSKLLQKWSLRGKKNWKRELHRSNSEQSLSLLSCWRKGCVQGGKHVRQIQLCTKACEPGVFQEINTNQYDQSEGR